MSRAIMRPPHLMPDRTPAQRRRRRHKLRKIYGMHQADRRRWIASWAARGVKIP